MEKTYYEIDWKMGAFKTCRTLEEAKKEVEACKNGHPENEYMSDENRNYWKEIGKVAEIYEVVMTHTKVA